MQKKSQSSYGDGCDQSQDNSLCSHPGVYTGI